MPQHFSKQTIEKYVEIDNSALTALQSLPTPGMSETAHGLAPSSPTNGYAGLIASQAKEPCNDRLPPPETVRCCILSAYSVCSPPQTKSGVCKRPLQHAEDFKVEDSNYSQVYGRVLDLPGASVRRKVGKRLQSQMSLTLLLNRTNKLILTRASTTRPYYHSNAWEVNLPCS